jgi:hypothetical protein
MTPILIRTSYVTLPVVNLGLSDISNNGSVNLRSPTSHCDTSHTLGDLKYHGQRTAHKCRTGTLAINTARKHTAHEAAIYDTQRSHTFTSHLSHDDTIVTGILFSTSSSAYNASSAQSEYRFSRWQCIATSWKWSVQKSHIQTTWHIHATPLPFTHSRQIACMRAGLFTRDQHSELLQFRQPGSLQSMQEPRLGGWAHAE